MQPAWNRVKQPTSKRFSLHVQQADETDTHAIQFDLKQSSARYFPNSNINIYSKSNEAAFTIDWQMGFGTHANATAWNIPISGLLHKINRTACLHLCHVQNVCLWLQYQFAFRFDSATESLMKSFEHAQTRIHQVFVSFVDARALAFNWVRVNKSPATILWPNDNKWLIISHLRNWTINYTEELEAVRRQASRTGADCAPHLRVATCQI